MSWDPPNTFSPALASAAPESQVTSRGPQPSVVVEVGKHRDGLPAQSGLAI